MFTAPSWFATLVLTVSPWRGIFILSPVLVLAAVAIVRRWKMGDLCAERRLILATLEHCDGDKKKAADVLKISLKTLYNRLNEYKSS